MHRRLNQAALGTVLLTLLACNGGGDSKAPTIVTGGGSIPSATTAVFDPSTGTVPLPNILASATALDPITSYVPPTGGAAGARPANTPMTPPEALAYVNLREMGGTNAVAGINAPIYLRFSTAVDATTVTAANVKVFQLTPDAAGTENSPLGFTDVSGLFSYRYTAGGTDLFLFPNFPLTPGTRYLYVVTNRVKDTSGLPITSSAYFEALKSTTALTGSFAALEPIRANAMSGANILLSGYSKVFDDLIAASTTTTVNTRGDVVLLGRFITTGAGFIPTDVSSAVATAASRIPVESALRKFAAGATLGGLSGKTWSNAATIPANTLPSGPFTTFVKGSAVSPSAYWTAVVGSTTAAPASVGLVALGTIASGDLSQDPVVVAAHAATMNLTGITGAFNPAAGVAQPTRDATTTQLTGFYHTDRTLNFVYIAPDPLTVTRPANGYPVVIYQHGITSQKETVIALAGTLTAKGYALVAIDLPLHGQNAVLLPTPHTTGASWGQDFMAIGAPLATRTNLQQGVVNLTRLELVIKTGGLNTALATAGLATSTPDITPVVVNSIPTYPNIKFVGVSLGAIVGSYYLASNATLATTGAPYSQASLNGDMKGFLNNPGARTAYLIQNSPAFGPTVDAGLAAVGIAKNTPTYHNFFQVTQSIVDPADPASVSTPLAAGLPSRLSGRVVIQEATSSAFDQYGNTTSTDGDQVISNAYTRYLGNALGGRAVLGTSDAAAVGPNFSQLAYTAAGAHTVTTTSGVVSTAHAAGVSGAPFMFTLTPTPAAKVANAATSVASTTPKEGYFQFDQTGIGHAFILNPANPVAIDLGQRQLVYWLATGLVVDPTQQSGTLPIVVTPTLLPDSVIFDAPEKISILGH